MLRTRSLLTLLMVLPALASAKKAETICPEIRVGAGISEAIQDKFDKAMRKAIDQQTDLLGAKQTEKVLKAAKIAPSVCAGPECGAALTKAAKVRFAVMSNVISEDEIYKVTMVVYDAAAGQITHKEEAACELCAVGEVISITMPKAAKGLAGALKAPMPEQPKADGPVDVQVQSTPPGADVYVGEVFQGKTPLSFKLAPGAHTFKLSKAGYEPEDREIEIKAGAQSPITLEFPLKVVAESTTALARANSEIERTDSYAQYGWGSIIGGAVLVGAGIWLIDLDGDVTCDDGRGRTECPNVYDTRWAGAGALGVGAAALGVGISLLVLDPGGVPTSPRPSVSPTPSGQGAMFQWGGQF